MKPLPLACFAAALFLVGIGILHHDQVKTRNAAARQVHEEKMEKHWQQVAKARHDEVDRHLANQKMLLEMQRDREISNRKIATQAEDSLRERAALWKGIVDQSSDEIDSQLRAAQEAADKDRGF